MENILTVQNEEKAQEVTLSESGAGIPNIWADKEALKQAWSIADFLSKSNLVPSDYRGESNKGNCLIAIDIAARLNLNPLMVMQTLYIVKGKPSWSGQMCISLVNACGRFTPLEFIYNDTKTSCKAVAIRKSDGTKAEGAEITLEMAKKENWGSKWNTMPEQMLAYRAGAFFARVHCPDVLMGIPTIEEMQDVSHKKEKPSVRSPFDNQAEDGVEDVRTDTE